MTDRARVAGARWWLLVAGAAGCAGAAGPGPGAAGAPVVICAEGEAMVGGRCAPAAAASSSAGALPVGPAAGAILPRPRLPSAADGIAPLVGRWLGEDNQASALYHLSLGPDGHFEQDIETLPGSSGRSPGTCHQAGRARVEDEQLFWYFEQNTCNADYEGREDPDRLVEHGPRSFVLDVEGNYQIHYARQ